MSCSKVVESVVSKGLCIGCGLCVSQCANNALKMKINESGFFEVAAVKACNCDGNCLAVCPFNPSPNDSIRTEDEISQLFLKNAKNYHPKMGRYINTYAGYSVDHRLSSSSGGIATYLLTELLDTREIDHIISVKESKKPNVHYEYAISSTKEELLKAAKTKYFPVTLDSVFQQVKNLDGKVAIVGVACFIKGIRLAQASDPILKDKIKFLVGIICGGIKSRFFTEYLASKSGVLPSEYSKPKFRIKDVNSTASDYSFGCLDKSRDQKIIKMWTVGDMWGTGLFKANACDFCDDVTTELADISLGDAWLEPFYKDGKGTNVIVTRSVLAEKIIQDGIKSGRLKVADLSIEKFLASQQGSFNHRHDGLSFRINRMASNEIVIPPKRFTLSQSSLLIKLIQIMRMRTRRKSLEIWRETKDATVFDQKMKRDLSLLKALTRLNHYQRAIIKRLNKVVSK